MFIAKPMRRANGTGSVYKLSGRRRKPYVACAPAIYGIDEEETDVKCTRKIVGYYRSRDEANAALAEYNNAPYDLDARKLTFAEVYEKWLERKRSTCSESALKSYSACYNNCSYLHDMAFSQIKLDHLQSVIDECEAGYPTRKKIRSLFSMLYEYALRHEICLKDYSKLVDIGSPDEQKEKKIFTREETQLLWDNVDKVAYVDTVLILIYTGLRISELLEIEVANIHLEERYMRGGKKTKAGKNRVIPLRKEIIPLVEKRIADSGKYLIRTSRDAAMSYGTYYGKKGKNAAIWNQIMDKLGLEGFTPHCTRHTFVSRMDTSEVNKTCTNRIVGHSGLDLADRVYTHKDIQELIDAVDKATFV